ncbi:hypothetical protein INR49_009518 [Caranx melampygus]|nr:hypothetical protein INR49_009518 [Caranx melampygus]
MIPECPRAGDTRTRTRFLRGSAAEQSQNRVGVGLLSEIKIPIINEPFTDHYTILPGKELGRGKFAVVRKCVEKRTGHEYAAKFMRKRRKGQDCRTEIVHEIAVLELATVSSRVVNLHQVYEMASEMVLPQNILLTSSSPLGDIKIVDFGLSRMVCSHQELREIMGTPEYVAPEILNYEPISTATDMWSIGVLAYVMLTGISPFLGEDKQETFLNISQLSVSYTEEELQQLDGAALSFIQMLLRKHPQDRATAEQCLQHPWLQPSEFQGTQTEEEIVPVDQDQDQDQEASSTSSSPGPPSSTTTAEEEVEEEGQAVTEELIVMAAYTLGQCRQSSSSETEVLVAEQKAVSKRFKFEEPFSALQEVPGNSSTDPARCTHITNLLLRRHQCCHVTGPS